MNVTKNPNAHTVGLFYATTERHFWFWSMLTVAVVVDPDLDRPLVAVTYWFKGKDRKTRVGQFKRALECAVHEGLRKMPDVQIHSMDSDRLREALRRKYVMESLCTTILSSEESLRPSSGTLSARDVTHILGLLPLT